jgi:hypothetical protein
MDVETQLQLLRQIPYFRAVSLDDLAEVVRTLRIRHCQKGEVSFGGAISARACTSSSAGVYERSSLQPTAGSRS